MPDTTRRNFFGAAAGIAGLSALGVESSSAAIEMNARRLAQVRRVEFDGLSNRFAPGKTFRFRTRRAGKTGNVLDVVEQAVDEGQPDIDEQQGKECRRPSALQSLMQRNVKSTAAKPVDEVIGQA